MYCDRWICEVSERDLVTDGRTENFQTFFAQIKKNTVHQGEI